MERRCPFQERTQTIGDESSTWQIPVPVVSETHDSWMEWIAHIEWEPNRSLIQAGSRQWLVTEGLRTQMYWTLSRWDSYWWEGKNDSIIPNKWMPDTES